MKALVKAAGVAAAAILGFIALPLLSTPDSSSPAWVEPDAAERAAPARRATTPDAVRHALAEAGEAADPFASSDPCARQAWPNISAECLGARKSVRVIGDGAPPAPPPAGNIAPVPASHAAAAKPAPATVVAEAQSSPARDVEATNALPRAAAAETREADAPAAKPARRRSAEERRARVVREHRRLSERSAYASLPAPPAGRIRQPIQFSMADGNSR
jgi:hypothetical protein